ncbi:MAG: helix-turn-helix transcriptional regulator, partial [Candidatus Brocadiales bacterium]|nr:helix-turn-helix transcriptional regulator [Candidatus Bathyanammoxibius sp.]
MQNFGKKLRERARQLNLADAEVARRAGLSERRYGHYVTGRNEPNLETLVRICTVLETTPNDLLGFEAKEALADKSPEMQEQKTLRER